MPYTPSVNYGWANVPGASQFLAQARPMGYPANYQQQPQGWPQGYPSAQMNQDNRMMYSQQINPMQQTPYSYSQPGYPSQQAPQQAPYQVRPQSGNLGW